MPNINDIPASDITVAPGPDAASGPIVSGNISQLNPQDIQTPEQYKEGKYGTVGQQILTGVEGLGHGLAGPVATGIEKGLSKLGVPGLTPNDQEARADVNPATHYGTEIAGFGLGAFTGSGEAALIGKVGEGAVSLAKLGEGASVASKIAGAGVKAGAELAALQTGDEISKAINNDPNQTLGTAAINIGLSGIMGGAGGAVLGSVSPLFKTAVNKTGIEKLASDFQGETKFLQMGIEPLNPFEKPTPGELLARWAHKSGAEALAKSAGETAAGTIGGIAGSLVGHPLVGAYISDRILSPLFSALAKPFAEKAVDSEAMRASVDYLANAIRGEFTLNKAVKDFFQTGEVIPKMLLPTAESRSKLEKSLESAQNPQNALQVGGNLSHYMPDHGTAAAAMAGAATSYFSALKPQTAIESPFDATPPPDKAAVAKYNRALDIAQQPLLVLKHAKQGTLLPQDIQTMQTLYPGLHSAIVQKLNTELISQKTAGREISYPQRVSLSMLTGSNLDSTMTPGAMQAIISSSQTPQGPVTPNGKSKSVSAAQLKAIDKSQSLYPTNIQQHQISRRR